VFLVADAQLQGAIVPFSGYKLSACGVLSCRVVQVHVQVHVQAAATCSDLLYGRLAVVSECDVSVALCLLSDVVLANCVVCQVVMLVFLHVSLLLFLVHIFLAAADAPRCCNRQFVTISTFAKMHCTLLFPQLHV
jgi:hypothetical protein